MCAATIVSSLVSLSSPSTVAGPSCLAQPASAAPVLNFIGYQGGSPGSTKIAL